MDSTSFFHDFVPSVDNGVTGLVTLLSVAYALGKYKRDNKVTIGKTESEQEHSWHLLVQNKQWKHQDNVWNLFKVNEKTSKRWCFHCWLWASKCLSESCFNEFVLTLSISIFTEGIVGQKLLPVLVMPQKNVMDVSEKHPEVFLRGIAEWCQTV